MAAIVHTVESLRRRITGEKIADFDITRPVERITCADGFTVSVQAGEHLYCSPRENGAAWTEVEMGFPSAPIPEFAEWRDGEPPDERNVFGYVPIERVVELINAHGGEVTP